MRKALSLLGKTAVSGFLLYFAWRTVDVAAVKGRLSQIDLRWIVLALVLLLVQTFVLALRWRQLVIRCGSTLSLGRLFRFSMIASFLQPDPALQRRRRCPSHLADRQTRRIGESAPIRFCSTA